jgi:rare lipoprotein A
MKYTCLFVALWLFWSLCPAKLYSQVGYTQQGKASYYAAKFDGRPTASGEKFTNKDLTAAHLTLAFNSLVKVTNVKNGKSVIVRINDRGPHIKARILDMSKAAAQEIDMVQSGIATVNIEVVGTEDASLTSKPDLQVIEANKPTIKTPTPDPDKKITIPFSTGHTFSQWGTERFPSGYGIQVASFADLDNAKGVCKELAAAEVNEAYIQVEWKDGGKVHRVLAGSFADEIQAQDYKQALEKLGFSGFIKKHF